MSVIKISPHYKRLIQMKIFCGPACVQMILFRRGIWIEQELLAYKISAKIDKKGKNLYVLPFKKLPSSDSRSGLENIKHFKKIKVKNFFEKYNLKVEVYPISKIEFIDDFIIKNLKNNNDIIVNFWWKPLIKNKNWGHYVLISEFDTKTKMMTVCDPSYNSKGFWKIKLNKIIKGMTTQFDGNERGFVVIKK